jgi:hypothetical protein
MAKRNQKPKPNADLLNKLKNGPPLDMPPEEFREFLEAMSKEKGTIDELPPEKRRKLEMIFGAYLRAMEAQLKKYN